MDDFFDTHTQTELQCSSLLYTLMCSEDFITDRTDLLVLLFDFLELELY